MDDYLNTKVLLLIMILFSSSVYSNEVKKFKFKNAFAINLHGIVGVNFRHKVGNTEYISLYINMSRDNSTINRSNSASYVSYGNETFFQTLFGYRKYLSHQLVSVFIEPIIIIEYESVSETSGTTPNLVTESYKDTGAGVGLKFGGEYFISEQFSIGGGLIVSAIYSKASGTKSGSGTSISTFESGLNVNYYF